MSTIRLEPIASAAVRTPPVGFFTLFLAADNGNNFGIKNYNGTVSYLSTGSPITDTNTIFRTGSGVPSNVLGSDNDTYLNISVGDIYQKFSGAYVLKYSFGAASFKFGIGTPFNANGDINDYYMDLSTSIIYQKTSTTVWTAIFIPLTGGSMFSGSGSPNSNTGAVNDFYIDIVTGNYYKKLSGGWNLIYTFIGKNRYFSGNSDIVQNDSTGSIDDHYFNYSNGKLFKKTNTGWIFVIQFVSDKNHLTSGTGAPNNNNGGDGDHYFDSSLAPFKWYKKSSGTWIALN